MSAGTKLPDPMERYAQRALAFAETDPQIKAMMPNLEVQAATQDPALSFSDIIGIVLDGYAARPMVGEREYDIATDSDTGHRVRATRPTPMPKSARRSRHSRAR
jgi:fatty acid CoA ligase FadD9